MRLDPSLQSTNVEDRRAAGSAGGGRFRGGASLGLGGVVVVIVLLLLGVEPRQILSLLDSGSSVDPRDSVDRGTDREGAERPSDPMDDERARFVSMVLGDTEATWESVLAASGRAYEKPKLVLFSGATPTACGLGESAMGPFYCPADRTVYIDLAFYRELSERFGAPGDFAQAYVIAHEVGHHIQTLLGITAELERARRGASEVEANAASVRFELQADCYAGVWANHADAARHILEAGDVEEGLAAASAIGDDTIQRRTRGYVVPESFTHGSSAERVKWFRTGLRDGTLESCDTSASGARRGP
ncbi:MAG: neutral zinc metallopeptidase [Acidobacteriota bacterium]